MPSEWPYTQAEHDEAVEVGGVVLWAFAVVLIAAAIVAGCTIS